MALATTPDGVSFNYFDLKEQRLLLEKVDAKESKKHKAMTLLMLDAGLRVSECVGLKFSDFDFRGRILNVRSLKKRTDRTSIRQVPLSPRLYEALAEYIVWSKARMGDSFNPDGWVFPSPCKEGVALTDRACRMWLSRLNKKHLNFEKCHPHQLRHTFATNHRACQTPLENIKDMLGHRKYDTTLIYAKVSIEELRKNVHQVTLSPKSLFGKALSWVKPQKAPLLINIGQSPECFVSRQSELARLRDYTERQINVLILGGVGMGKSVLLKHFRETSKSKILHFDDLAEVKKSLVSCLIYLYKNDKEQVAKLLFGDFDLGAIQTRLSRESIPSLCDEIKKLTEKGEYILTIDSLDRLQPRAEKALTELKDHFTIVACARSIPVNRSTFVWNFQTIPIESFNRKDSFMLVDQLSKGLEVEDYDLYRSHIFEQSGGNPRVVFELCERYRKEPILTAETIRQVQHFGALREWDFTWVILVGLGILTCMRYLARDVGNENLRLIGGVALILMLLFRNSQKVFKRRAFKA